MLHITFTAYIVYRLYIAFAASDQTATDVLHYYS